MSQPSAPSGEVHNENPPPAARTPKSLGRLLREWITSLAFALVILIPIRSSLADWNDVPSGSMRPTILEGERIYINKLAYGLRLPLTQTWLARWDSPARGDIVTFASPKDGERLVKRVVGLPGDRISMRDNTLYINGAPAERRDIGPGEPNILRDMPPIPTHLQREVLSGHDHTITLTPSVKSARTFAEVTVPHDTFFVLGDNRDISGDSRFIGFVPLGNIYGRASAVVASVDPQHWYMPRWSRCLTGLK